MAHELRVVNNQRLIEPITSEQNIELVECSTRTTRYGLFDSLATYHTTLKLLCDLS